MVDSKSAWQTLAARTVYDNPWIRVEEHQVINPSGGENLYGKVCFKNRAVAVLALDAEGRIHLVGQHRYTLDEYSWELPMGGAPLDEDPLRAAQRELREETGLTAARWEALMHLHPSNSVTDETAVVYVARELSQGPPQFGETEDLTLRILPLDEALRWVATGRITDAVSVAGILRWWADSRGSCDRGAGD